VLYRYRLNLNEKIIACHGGQKHEQRICEHFQSPPAFGGIKLEQEFEVACNGLWAVETPGGRHWILVLCKLLAIGFHRIIKW